MVLIHYEWLYNFHMHSAKKGKQFDCSLDHWFGIMLYNGLVSDLVWSLGVCHIQKMNVNSCCWWHGVSKAFTSTATLDVIFTFSTSAITTTTHILHLTASSYYVVICPCATLELFYCCNYSCQWCWSLLLELFVLQLTNYCKHRRPYQILSCLFFFLKNVNEDPRKTLLTPGCHFGRHTPTLTILYPYLPGPISLFFSHTLSIAPITFFHLFALISPFLPSLPHFHYA